MNTRIYKVTIKPADKPTEKPMTLLVTAGSQAQARAYVTNRTIEVSVATQSDLVNYIGQGVKVEDATQVAE